MSSAEHELIWKLLDNRTAIQRTVRELDNGVETTTTTTQADLVEPLRQHVRGMLERMEQDRPVRWWDPVFRSVFSRTDQIDVSASDVTGGIVVTETSGDPEAVKAVKAHATAVSRFVAEGRSAACPPWAPGNR